MTYTDAYEMRLFVTPSTLCMEEPQAVERWLQRRLSADGLRKRTFGIASFPIGILTTDPINMMATF